MKEVSKFEKYLVKKLDKINVKVKSNDVIRGNTIKYTFHAGFTVGYYVGKQSMLENILDEYRALQNEN